MIVCAGWSEKTTGSICKFFLGVIDSSMGFVRKIVSSYVKQSISDNWIISKLIILVPIKFTSSESERSRAGKFNGVNFIKIAYVVSRYCVRHLTEKLKIKAIEAISEYLK